MGELWQQTSEMLWQRPLLWLPVLLADLLSFLVNLGSASLLDAIVRRDLQYRSVLGGPAMRAPLSPATVEHATYTVLLITWSANFLRLFFYAAAFVATAALVAAIASRARKQPAAIGPALGRHLGGIFALAFQIGIVYFVCSLLFGWITRGLVAHGHKAVLANGWLEIGVGVLLVGLLAWIFAPTALSMLNGRSPQPAYRDRARVFAFTLAAIAFLLVRFVVANMRAVHIAEVAARYALELTGSWIAALPYAALFVGLALLARRSEAEAELAQEPDTSLQAH